MHRRFRRIQGREIYDVGRPLSFGSLKCDLPEMLVNDRFQDALSQPIALIGPIGLPTRGGLEKGLLNIERQSFPFVLYIEALPRSGETQLYRPTLCGCFDSVCHMVGYQPFHPACMQSQRLDTSGPVSRSATDRPKRGWAAQTLDLHYSSPGGSEVPCRRRAAIRSWPTDEQCSARPQVSKTTLHP